MHSQFKMCSLKLPYLHHWLDLCGPGDDASDLDELADALGLDVANHQRLLHVGRLEAHLVPMEEAFNNVDQAKSLKSSSHLLINSGGNWLLVVLAGSPGCLVLASMSSLWLM